MTTTKNLELAQLQLSCICTAAAAKLSLGVAQLTLQKRYTQGIVFMDWYLILAIAIPFLFVIGVINNAIKDQRKLEKGKLQGFLRKRVGKSDQPYDDEDDDWGVKARQDLKKAVEETSSSNQAKVLKGAQHDGNNSNIEPGQELKQGLGQEHSKQDRLVSDLSQNNPLSNKTVGNFKPLGDTKAKNASDYFANYYKQSYTP